MEDALAHLEVVVLRSRDGVLILVVMEDALAQRYKKDNSFCR